MTEECHKPTRPLRDMLPFLFCKRIITPKLILCCETRIFRDGKPIYTGAPTPLEMTGQKDPHRPTGGAQLSLGSELLAGEYVLQIIVEDHLAKEKTRTATRWIDFEVIK